MRFFKRLEAAHLNGLSVALGVSATHLVVSALCGDTAGLAAVGGAVCASLPDLPNPPQRVLPRVLPAAAAAAVVTLLVGVTDHSLVLTVAVVAVVTFLSLMALAWGLRAGPLSFSPVLALVFAMAWDRTAGAASPWEHALWVGLGGCVYAGWARLSAVVLRHRLRQLALAGALRATERRLRSRAQRIAGAVSGAEASIRASIADDVVLAEALQSARDQVFAARRSARSRKQTDLVLGLIELRDLMLASRLDTELLGQDFPGRQWRSALADAVRQLADVLRALADDIELGTPLPEVSVEAWRAELARRLGDVSAPAGDSRLHLVSAMQSRLGHMQDDVAAMVARQLRSDDPGSPWTPERLAPFVSPEGLPLAALRPHLNLQSGVMRHALRSALGAVGGLRAGCGAALVGPPVLADAQRRRGAARQPGADAVAPQRTHHRHGAGLPAGAAAGALRLRALPEPVLHRRGGHGARLREPPLPRRRDGRHADGAAAAADAGAGQRPGHRRAAGRHGHRRGPGVAVQLRAAVLGACHRAAAGDATARRAGPARGQHAALDAQRGGAARQRLSRQQAYTALAALAGAAQRTRVEPLSVRLPEAEIEAALSHGYRLMALLGAVQHQVQRRSTRLDAARAETALPLAQKACVDILKGEPGASDKGTDPADIPDGDAGAWPEHLNQQDLTPWLLRRLRLCRFEARELVAALNQLQPVGERS